MNEAHVEGPGEPAAPAWLRRPDDLNAINPALWPTGTSRDNRGVMVIADQGVDRLMAELSSPLYVIDEADFRARAAHFAQEFTGWGVYYASKSFLCRAVARWIEQAGLGLDVCSANELAVALAVGFPPERIGLHGNNKPESELVTAIQAGVGHIIVDCFEEITRLESLAGALGRTVTVLPRITTGIEAHTHEYIATSHEDQKFGFSIHSGQAMAALMACRDQPHLDLAGIHCHIGSQITDAEGYAVAAQRMVDLLADFRDAAGSQLSELNLGGGFGISYTGVDPALDITQWRRTMTSVVEQACSARGLGSLKLSIEPGRAISGPAGVALYTVGVVKPVDIGQGRQRVYVAVDGGMSDNIRTALYHADYTALLANRTSTAEPVLSRVVGSHCESGDILVRDVYLPADLRPGDVLAVPAAGAYARAMASNYNWTARPPVVAVNAEGAYPIIRRETLEDLMALDVG